jgi:hypothetical protein
MNIKMQGVGGRESKLTLQAVGDDTHVWVVIGGCAIILLPVLLHWLWGLKSSRTAICQAGLGTA